MTTKKHLRDKVAQLEHDLADARRVHVALLDHANASEQARIRFAHLTASAQRHAQDLADKLNDIEAQCGHWSTSTSTIYRKAAETITRLINPPEDQPELEPDPLQGHAPGCQVAQFDGRCCRPTRPEPLLPDPVVMSA